MCWPELNLASQARQAGVVYSMAYGDQPALTMEMIDWARSCGFNVVAAGKGTKYLPNYHQSTPDTVWSHYGLSAEQAAAAGMRSQMFNSFLDGTKSSIEMAAIANAANLRVPTDGLAFPPCGADDLAQVLRPASAGGQLEFSGQVEVVSSLERDGGAVTRDLRWGVLLRVRGAQRLQRGLFQTVRHEHRRQRALLGNVQALPPDRTGTQYLYLKRRAARQADRRPGWLQRRRGRGGEARHPARRNARRRRRLHRLGKTDSSGGQCCRAGAADRARQRCQSYPALCSRAQSLPVTISKRIVAPRPGACAHKC